MCVWAGAGGEQRGAEEAGITDYGEERVGGRGPSTVLCPESDERCPDVQGWTQTCRGLCSLPVGVSFPNVKFRKRNRN